jgi:hypothetical protein
MDTLQIRIPKAGKSIEIDADTVNSLDPSIFQEIIVAGLEALLNKRMSKITGVTKLEGAEKADAQASAFKIANENLAKLKAGESLTRKKTEGPKLSAQVRAEAMRLARMIIKDSIREAGMRVSEVETKVITEAAKQYLAGEGGPALIAQAEANLAKKPKVETKIDLSALGVAVSPKLVAKLKAEKAERKTQGSAASAGRVTRRGQRPTAH